MSPEERVPTTKKVKKMIEKSSLASLYLGVLLGALIGITGNFHVSFWFQELTGWNLLGLIVSFILFLGLCLALFIQTRKYAKKYAD